MSDRVYRWLIVSLMILVLCSPGFASTVDDSTMSRFRVLFPNSNIVNVRKSPIEGLYEVEAGSTVFYSTGNGRYIVFGHIYDAQQQRDLTAELKRSRSNDIDARPVIASADDAATKINFDSLPIKDAVLTVKGNGSRKLVVFTDPLCGYCKQLTSSLAEIGDLTLYSFVVSILPMQSDIDRAIVFKELGCSNDSSPCRDKLARNTALFESLGLRGTPTMIRVDSAVSAGALSATDIQKWITEAKVTGQIKSSSSSSLTTIQK
jgi:thiol:disulfide interchange protein DsbC